MGVNDTANSETWINNEFWLCYSNAFKLVTYVLQIFRTLSIFTPGAQTLFPHHMQDFN